MKKNKYLIIKLFLIIHLCSVNVFGQSVDTLAPKIVVDNHVFMNNIINMGDIKTMSITARMKEARQEYAKLDNDKSDLSQWPKFFLKNVLNSTTYTLNTKMETLIIWMDSKDFKEMDDISRLGYIEKLAEELSPFEKILFYEGVYYVEIDSDYLGFNIKVELDNGLRYFYGDTLFAYGSYYTWGDYIDLSFGNYLHKSKITKIDNIHFYTCMKQLIDAYLKNPEKKLFISNQQLTFWGKNANSSFLPRALNFYLLKIEGFSPEYKPQDVKSLNKQKEYLLKLKQGQDISFQEAQDIISTLGLIRDIAQEEVEYFKAVKTQSKKTDNTSLSAENKPQQIELPYSKSILKQKIQADFTVYLLNSAI